MRGVHYFGLFLLLSGTLQAQEEPQIRFLPENHFHSAAITIELVCSPLADSIFYSSNGELPDDQAERYDAPISIDSTTTLQIVAYHKGKKSKVFTNTYFIGEETKFPVVALSIRPGYLFDPLRGLFEKGPKAEAEHPFKGANFYLRNEVECHVEFFETNRDRVFNGKFGFRVFGGRSRSFPQKSFSISARKDKYGIKRIPHKVFPNKDIKKFKHLVFRNSGSDYGETHFRDALITSIGGQMGLEVQAYRHCLVYINGKYWGFYNIREKLTTRYLEENFGYKKDSIDLIEHQQHVNAGSRLHYDRMQSFMKKNDLAEQKNFDAVGKMMDIDNFIDYQIIQMYINNEDAGGNIKFWRPQKPEGRWRWILYDTDFGLGHHGGGLAYQFNSLAFSTEPNGPHWPNPPWSTYNLRMLLKNQGFRDSLALRLTDHLNSTFRKERLTALIDSMAGQVIPEMPRHFERWGLDLNFWDMYVRRMKVFVEKRPQYMLDHFEAGFETLGKQVKLKIRMEGKGSLSINGRIPIFSDFEGTYFQNIPIHIKAQPRFGYQFSHWEDAGTKRDSTQIRINFSDSVHLLKAIFEKTEHPHAQQALINEINNQDTLAGDWIEFFNNSKEAINLKGWQLRDRQNNRYTFPDVEIEANHFLILCQDSSKFQEVWGDYAKGLIGNLGFGIGQGRERLELYDAQGAPVDSVGYDLREQKNATPYVLSLRRPEAETNNFLDWDILNSRGNPNQLNPNYLLAYKQKELNSLVKAAQTELSTLGIFSTIISARILERKRLIRQKKKPAN